MGDTTFPWETDVSGAETGHPSTDTKAGKTTKNRRSLPSSPVNRQESDRNPNSDRVRPYYHYLVNERFLRACRRESVDVTPVWFMRQAGRYMPEYRTLRARHTLLEICRAPDLAAEVTLQPVQRLDVDAAILFSDLLLPLAPMGIPFDFVKGEGPTIKNPILLNRRRGKPEAIRATGCTPSCPGHH